MKLLLSTLGLSVAFISVSFAELTVAPIFTDNAVLQRDTSVPVWGTAEPGKAITISYGGQTKTTVANSETGRWKTMLDPLIGSAEPRSLKVIAGEEALTFSNLLVGEVWLASGQSNMAMRVDLVHNPEKEKADSNLPKLRVFTVDRAASTDPVDTCSGEWLVSSSEVAGQFSATGFFFARELHEQLNVPVGLIVAAWSGSAIEAWTSDGIMKDQGALQELLNSWADKEAAYTPEVEAEEKATYEKDFATWKTARKEAIAADTEPPKAPRRPINPRLHHHHPSVLYNGMIAPIIPYAIRGAIWYQGETNAFTEETSALYEFQLPLLIEDWRQRWARGDFPFAWVQLPPSRAEKVAWARIRESMRRATAIPNTGMAVTIDLGEEPFLLHPKNKRDYAHRLALWARAEVYGEDVVASGPRLTGHRSGEKGMLLRFDQAEDLAPSDQPLRGFELQDSDGNWVTADARLHRNGVVAIAKGVSHPAAARYAWANHPEGNLFNKAGLPASPLTTEAANHPLPQPPSPAAAQKRATKGPPQDLNTTPFVPVDVTKLPSETERLDVFLLMGQSNMKGRGVMPAEPLQDPQIIMLHKKTDEWFHARHPLHHVGNPKDFTGSDNAGVGPGLAFAQTLTKSLPENRIALIPCAVGGTSLGKWQKGQRLFEETIRRAKLALEQGPEGKTRIAGALWLQGESDSNSPERIAAYQTGIKQMIEDLRADLGIPKLPFIACTIGELKAGQEESRGAINAILLDLPNQVPHTACVDSRDFSADIGDSVHFDTATQERHGKLYAKKYGEMLKK